MEGKSQVIVFRPVWWKSRSYLGEKSGRSPRTANTHSQWPCRKPNMIFHTTQITHQTHTRARLTEMPLRNAQCTGAQASNLWTNCCSIVFLRSKIPNFIAERLPAIEWSAQMRWMKRFCVAMGAMNTHTVVAAQRRDESSWTVSKCYTVTCWKRKLIGCSFSRFGYDAVQFEFGDARQPGDALRLPHSRRMAVVSNRWW